MTGWHVFRKESYQPYSVVVLAVLALCGGPLFAVAPSSPSGTAGYEVITLKNITPERGKEFLCRLKLGTVSKLPGSNALLVTAGPSGLQKAVAVLHLVDTRTEFDIKDLGPAGAEPLLSSAQIAGAAGGVSVGTFAHPPQDKSKIRAIIDVHNGSIVAIAPAFQMQKIQLALERNAPAPATQEAPRVNPPGSNLQPASGDSPQTIAAPALLGSAFSAETAGEKPDAGTVPGKIPEPAEVEPQTPRGDPSTPLAPANDTPPTAEPKAEPTPLAQSSAKPEPVTPAAAQPTGSQPAEGQSTAKVEPAAAANPQPTGSKPPETQPNAPPAEPSAPARSNEPAPKESAAPAAQPAETAPASPIPVTPSASSSSPRTTPVAAAQVVGQTQDAAASSLVQEIPNGDELLDLTTQERMPIIMLLDLVGKHLGLSYVYNPDEVKGEVSLKLNGDPHGFIKVKDLYTLLEATLRQNNLATTRRPGNIVLIMPIGRTMDGDPVLIDGVTRAQAGDTAVTRKFELKHIDTAAAKNLLESMKAGIDVTTVPEKHMLIVTAYAYRMNRIERLLQMVDLPGEPKKFRPRQLRYTVAKTLADKVKAMAEQMLESVTVTVAESETTSGVPTRLAGENEQAYRARVTALRVQQQQQQAALRAQQMALRATTGTPDTKPSVYLDADERTNRVLMIGAEKQLAIVEQLVEAMDVQQQDLRHLELYRMQHADAEDVARKLQELGVISKLPDGSTSSSRYPTGTSRITPQLPGQPRLPNAPTPEPQVAPTTEVTEKGLVEEPQVVVVEATNSLLVNATLEQHAKIAHIIEFVDSETLTNEIPYKIYPLENSSPKHLSEVLQSLIQDTIEQQKEGGKIEKVVVNKEEKIKIVADPNTYSLIVYANKKNQEWIANLITQLDKRRPQVLIDVTLVEITKFEKFDYDLNLVRGSPSLAGTSGATGAVTGDKLLGKAIQTGSNGLTAFYGDKQVQALLNTVQEKTYGRVLAKPKLLVNDNEKGTIETKDTTYVEVTSTMPVASGVPGQATGVVQSSTNFNSYDAGITLDITPHISEGDLLRLDIKLMRSDFGAILATRPPDKKSTDVKTAVTLPNGSTVILGGMLKMKQSKGGTKVPLLGDIPLLGGLFRSIHNLEDGTKLYLFVKAEIIRPDETSSHGMKDLEVLSERNRQAFEKHELEFQTYQDWPGVKSKRIDPSKVLDAQ